MGAKLIKSDPKLFKVIDTIFEKSYCGYIGSKRQWFTRYDNVFERLNTNYILTDSMETPYRKMQMIHGRRVYIFDVYSRKLILHKFRMYLNIWEDEGRAIIKEYLREYNSTVRRKHKVK